MSRLLNHLRSNLVAYVALFVALGGTSYAAVELPINSVGNAQIRNNSIQPDKLDSAYTRGEVRAWARVSAKGKVIGGGHGIKVEPQGSVKGDYFVEPARNGVGPLPTRCGIVASVDAAATEAGYANGEITTYPGKDPNWQAVIFTFDPEGQHGALPFDFVIIC